MALPPTVFGPERLLADIAADLTLRGLTGVSFLVGEWRTQEHYGTPRVIVGIGKATIESAAQFFRSTDGWIDVGVDLVARARLARVHTFPIWVHGYASSSASPADVAQLAQEAALRLVDLVAGAVGRTRHGLPILPWNVEPYAEERGEFVDGTVQRLDVRIAVPIFDDPSPTAQAEQISGESQLDLGDDELAPDPPETVTEEEES